MGNEASQYGKKIENDVKIEWAKEDVKCPYVPREGQACAVVKSKIYFFGGVTPLLDGNAEDESVMETDELIVFDVASKKWSKEAYNETWPSQRSGATMVSVKNNLYLFGGLSQLSGWLNDMFVYNTDTKTWKEISAPDAPSPRDKVASVALDDVIYVFGGFGPVVDNFDKEDVLPDDDDDEYEDMDELQEVRNCQDAANFTWSNQLFTFDTGSHTWSLVRVNKDAPSPRAAHTLTCVKQKSENCALYVFGGRDSQSRRNDLWKFDIEKSVWEECKGLGCPPEPRSFHAASSAGSRVFIYGGRSMKDHHFNDLHIFDTETNEWLQPGPATKAENASGDQFSSPAVGLHSLCTATEYLVLFGGSSDLDPATGTCIKVYNDIYYVPIKQLLAGGAIQKASDAAKEESDKPSIPTLVDLKPNKSNGTET